MKNNSMNKNYIFIIFRKKFFYILLTSSPLKIIGILLSGKPYDLSTIAVHPVEKCKAFCFHICSKFSLYFLGFRAHYFTDTLSIYSCSLTFDYVILLEMTEN